MIRKVICNATVVGYSFTDRRLVEDKYFPEIEQILRSELKGLDKVRNISRTFHLAKLKAC